MGSLVLAGAMLAVACIATANQAPLDTLQSPTGSEPVAAATVVAGPMSRSHLPEAKATTVPVARATGRPPRLNDPLAARLNYRRARRAAQAGDAQAAGQNLAAAMEASPSQPDIFLWQGLQAVKSLDTGALFHSLPAFAVSLARSPVDQGRLLIGLQQAAILATALFWSLFLLALYMTNWRHLAHDWTALLLRNRSHHRQAWLPAVLPLVLLAFKPGWLGFLAIASVPLLIRCRTRGRWLLLGSWLTALVLVFPWWPLLRSAVPTLDPASEVVTLNRACTLPPSASLRRNLQSRLEKAEDLSRRVRLLTALGIQEARAGDYRSSTRRFDSALALKPDCLPAQVGKGNNLYYQGMLDAAMNVYKHAVADHPRCGQAHYNLAQVYFRKLFVPEATSELEESRHLGFDPGDKADHEVNKGTAPVVYPGLTRSSYIAACRSEAGNYPTEITIAGWLPLLGIPGLPLYALLGLPLLLVILVIMGQGPAKGPRECANCGVPLCKTCRKVRDGASMCAVCGEIAQRAQSDMILATLLKNRSRSEGMATTGRIVRMGRFLPGAGHLAGGRLWGAWLRLSLLTVGMFLAAAGWAFGGESPLATAALRLPLEMIDPVWYPLPAHSWPGWTGLPMLAGLAILAGVWLVAFTDARRLHHMLPERYSLIPVAAKDNTVPSYGAEVR